MPNWKELRLAQHYQQQLEQQQREESIFDYTTSDDTLSTSSSSEDDLFKDSSDDTSIESSSYVDYPSSDDTSSHSSGISGLFDWSSVSSGNISDDSDDSDDNEVEIVEVVSADESESADDEVEIIQVVPSNVDLKRIPDPIEVGWFPQWPYFVNFSSSTIKSIGTTDARKLIDTAIDNAVFAYRSAFHGTLKTTPGGLAFGRDMILNLPLITDLQLLQKRRQKLVDEQLIKANAKRFSFDYQVNQEVLKLVYKPDKMDPRAEGPYRIEQVHTNGTLTIRLDDNTIERINIRRVKPYYR